MAHRPIAAALLAISVISISCEVTATSKAVVKERTTVVKDLCASLHLDTALEKPLQSPRMYPVFVKILGDTTVYECDGGGGVSC